MITEKKLNIDSIDVGKEICIDNQYMIFVGFLTDSEGSIVSGLFEDSRYNLTWFTLNDIKQYINELNESMLDNYIMFPNMYSKPLGFTEEEIKNEFPIPI